MLNGPIAEEAEGDRLVKSDSYIETCMKLYITLSYTVSPRQQDDLTHASINICIETMSHIAIHSNSILPLLAFISIHFLALCQHTSPAALNESSALLCLKSQLLDPSGALASWRDESRVFC
jgi:hypothetical protein